VKQELECLSSIQWPRLLDVLTKLLSSSSTSDMEIASSNGRRSNTESVIAN
jgi:hypothetical protein